MRTLEQWLDLYEESHKNPKNVLIHNICVPVITWCIVSFIYQLFSKFLDASGTLVVIALAGVFYLRLSLIRGGLMVLVLAAMYAMSHFYPFPNEMFIHTIGLFVAAWAGQFYGHYLEGKKPSFVDDLRLLFIGPLWVNEKIIKLLKR